MLACKGIFTPRFNHAAARQRGAATPQFLAKQGILHVSCIISYSINRCKYFFAGKPCLNTRPEATRSLPAQIVEKARLRRFFRTIGLRAGDCKRTGTVRLQGGEHPRLIGGETVLHSPSLRFLSRQPQGAVAQCMIYAETGKKRGFASIRREMRATIHGPQVVFLGCVAKSYILQRALLPFVC